MTTNLPHVLVVDDDRQIGDLLLQFLGGEGFRVTAVEDGESLRRIIPNGDIDVIVLDLMLPGEDGLSLLKWLRATTDLPVIMLTAMDGEADRVLGLDLGADDYLAKPFSSRELLARIKAVMRRMSAYIGSDRVEQRRSQVLEFNGWVLNAVQRTLHSADGVQVDLTSGEFDILLVFLHHPQQILTRDQLLDLARGRVSGPFDRTIDVQVGRLRQKLEVDPKSPEMFKTIRGGGYMLTCAIKTVT